MAVNAVLKEFALQRRIDVDKQGCIYNTGADRVYIDAERSQLDTQLTRHIDHTALGGAIDGLIHKGNAAGNGGDIDNLAAFVGFHSGCYTFDHQPGALQSDIVHVIPVCLSSICDRCHLGQTCGVDKNINGAISIQGLPNSGFNTGLLRNIALNSHSVAAIGFDVVHGLRGRVAVQADNLYAFLTKSGSNTSADTSCRAGYDCNFSLNACHKRSSLNITYQHTRARATQERLYRIGQARSLSLGNLEITRGPSLVMTTSSSMRAPTCPSPS